MQRTLRVGKAGRHAEPAAIRFAKKRAQPKVSNLWLPALRGALALAFDRAVAVAVPAPKRCPWLRTSDVHTLRFAFRAPRGDDESVKMSNPALGSSSVLPAPLSASRRGVDRRPKRQFLFNTNDSFTFMANFSTRTKQSTSFFLFDTNERSLITTHQSLLRDISTGRRPRCARVYTRFTSSANRIVAGCGRRSVRAAPCLGETSRRRVSG
jgi:hypothetical protein